VIGCGGLTRTTRVAAPSIGRARCSILGHRWLIEQAARNQALASNSRTGAVVSAGVRLEAPRNGIGYDDTALT
jgi:hypothetical protein